MGGGVGFVVGVSEGMSVCRCACEDYKGHVAHSISVQFSQLSIQKRCDGHLPAGPTPFCPLDFPPRISQPFAPFSPSLPFTLELP